MHKYYIALFILGLIACSTPVELEGTDLEGWKSDIFGCELTRANEIDNIMNQKSRLEGISSDDLMATLGKPDQVELYKRSQKFMVYYIDPGPQCVGNEEVREFRVLKVRVDALGTVKELILIK